MKANELMIGDWVLFSGEPKRVRSIVVSDDNRVERIYVFENTCQVSTIEAYIQPIPLTPEILEKNGFFRLGKQYNTWCMRGFNFSLDFIDGVFGYYEQGKPHNPTFVTKYVHELQHALKLCGIDKNIEL